MEANLSPVGLIIAIVFSGTVGSLLWWMLHPPVYVRVALETVAKGEEEMQGSIIVPITGSPLSEKLLNIATNFAQRLEVPLRFVYVMEIPLVLPPDAEIPKEREKGERVLLHAQVVAEKAGIVAKGKIVKARLAGAGIVQAAREDNASMILLLLSEHPGEEITLGRSVQYVVRNAPCDVLLLKPSIKEVA
jgi:nucleotide-binding universal stress UspA family protein